MKDRPGPSARWRMPAAIRASIGLHVVAALAVAAVAVERLVIGAWGAWSPAVLAASVGAIALNHAVLTLAGLCPRCSLLGGNVTRVPTRPDTAPEVAITIDDGPDPAVTPAVLDLLREAGAHASFFLVAERAKRHPDLVARIVAEGHSVENHTHAHSHAFSFSGPARLRREIARAQAVAGAVRTSRDWVNTAPNELRPPAFADVVSAAAREAGLEVEVLDEAALKAGGYGGILAVGQGSEAPPRLVKLTWTPEGGGNGKRVALVGKGITFDTGGISIKPAQGMWEMKSDMAGAAAVGAAMLAVAALKPSVTVTGYLPMAENMPSGTSYRPGDVISMFNGKKVEVLNTDAEGRMVLADAMARACADGADYLFETSTLTGGQVIALGKRIAGVMGTPELCERVRVAGDATGEPAWPMPLPDDVRKGMEADVADISQVNAGMDRAGHMLQGGVFLREFVTDDVAWAHIDIAGPGYHSGEATGYWTKGGTGVPVRTLVHLVEDVATNG